MLTTLIASGEMSVLCRKTDIWQKLINIVDYPNRIPQIDKISIIGKEDPYLLTEWFMTIDGAPFSWIERDLLDEENQTVSFEMIRGDFDKFKGTWNITSNPEGRFVLNGHLEYELGIPVIEEHLGNILKEKMQQFLNSALQKQCEYIGTGCVDERTCGRAIVNCRDTISIDGRDVDVDIINISCGGMMFRILKGLLYTDDTREQSIVLSETALNGRLYFDAKQSQHRVSFSNPLQTSDLKKLCAIWMVNGLISRENITMYEIIAGKPEHIVRK